MTAPAATRLSCAQTPLAWPAGVALTDLPPCTGCAIRLDAPHAGSLQVLTRRSGGGAGDGVTVEEARGAVAVDYRGQRYTLLEAVFQTPGLHVFPGQTDVYPAEYHLHFQTFSAPQRKLVLVVPVSHKVTGVGSEYFAAIRAQPDPAATRPTLLSLFAGATTIDTVQFRGADLLGRTSETPTQAEQCGVDAMDTMMALVLRPCQIRAADLERIPREGSLSTDPRDLPVQPRLKPSTTVSRAQLLAVAVLARPGLQLPGGVKSATLKDTSGGSSPGSELECYPLEVQGGKDVIVTDTATIPLSQLLGFGGGTAGSGGAVRGGLLGIITGKGAPPSDQEKQEIARTIALFASPLLTLFLSIASWMFFSRVIFDPTSTSGISDLGIFICFCTAYAAFETTRSMSS
jgi:hypothetical protein